VVHVNCEVLVLAIYDAVCVGVAYTRRATVAKLPELYSGDCGYKIISWNPIDRLVIFPLKARSIPHCTGAGTA